jgi:zona occludens toxin (predicted ATPase)
LRSRAVDDRHSAAAGLALEHVAVAQGFLECVADGHGGIFDRDLDLAPAAPPSYRNWRPTPTAARAETAKGSPSLRRYFFIVVSTAVDSFPMAGAAAFFFFLPSWN